MNRSANPESTGYHHTQRGPWAFLLYALGIPLVALAWFVRHDPPAPFIVAGVGLVLLALAPCFHRLTVSDEGDHLAIRFGPVPIFKTIVRYQDIEAAEVGRTWLIEGWGIHQLSFRRGMVWNIWGRDCVVIRHRQTIRVGTDDPENLLAFLNTKLTGQSRIASTASF